MKPIVLAILTLGIATNLATAEEKFYTEPQLFHFLPDPNASTNTIGRLGPIGLGLELRKPAFTMYISNVEEGSPAAQTGKLKKGQIIESINGEVLKNIDPRIQLGNLITKIEASDGVVRMMIKDKPKADAYLVEFKIPVLGAYSDTWPVNCAKSDAIVKQMSAYLREAETWGWGAALFLLSTGEPEDLEAVRQRFSGKLGEGGLGHTWSIGYKGIAVCEYYLRTGDKSVLPAIQASHDHLFDTVYNDSWMGRGNANFNYMAGGHLNAAGLHAVTFLLMAKECGADVNEEFLKDTFRHLYRYAGRGNVAYGDQMPEGGMTDNGKVGKLAFVLQAAANLAPEGKKSVYENARDISGTKSFYSTSWLFHGHTGGGIGELWRGPAMGVVKDKRPTQYRSFMDERRWMYELARTHEGAFGWAAGFNVNYTGVNDGRQPGGNYIPLIYTLPRQQLRIFGAPPTKHSQTYELPERIWGTSADDAFYSLEPGEYAPGERLDISLETIRNDASKAIFDRIKDPQVPESVLHAYALHIDQGIRDSTMGQIKNRGLHHLTMQLLKSKDPRGRHSGLMGVSALPKPMSDEVAGLLIAMIEDPEESWWVVMEALKNLGSASADQLAPHVAAIEKWLGHDDWWLQASAIQAASPLALDERFYKRLIPRIAEVMATSQRPGILSYFLDVAKQTRTAEKPIQEFAKKQFGKAYVRYPETISAPGAQDMSDGTEYMIRHLAKAVADTPGGLDALYEVAKTRFPDISLPHKELYLQADPKRLGPELQESMKKTILEDLIPEYIGTGTYPQSNRGYLISEAASEPLSTGFYYRRPRMAGLVDLYQRAGIDDYNWQDYGPKWNEMTWHYHSFNPPEKKLPGTGTRYREVTLPAGTEAWFMPGFDPEKAGWQTGKQPFGQKNGELVEHLRGCKFDFCRCDKPMQTLWENEVMLMHGKFNFPEFKNGHRYRILVGGMSHVNAGDGFQVYVGGEKMFERERGVGKREGGQPLAYYVDRKWWPNFQQKETTMAAMSFLRVGQNDKRRHFSIWLQEMKVPPMGRDVILNSATKMPMFSAEWQMEQDAMRNTGENDGKYVWDGKFVPNPKIQGSWTQLGQVAAIDEFDPGGPIKGSKRAPFQEIVFKDDGATHDGLMIWSDKVLMDLRKNQALRMTPKTINGMEYLFIEVGGFNAKLGPDWKSPLYVMKRNQGKADR